MRDAVTSSSFQHGTGSFEHSSAGQEDSGDSGTMYRVGQAAMVLSGVALVALAAKRGRSWQTIGAAALAGAPVIYRGATGHWPVPQALAQKASDAVATAPVETAVTINKPRAELYAFWRRLENLPRFMKNLDAVADLGGGRSHWSGKSPLGFQVEWDAEIVEEREGSLLAWRSLPGSQVHHAGTVRFEDAAPGRGTTVRVTLEFHGTGIGQAVGKALSAITEQQVREDIRRFKQLMEAGELPTTDGQPHGTRSFIGHLHNPI